MTTEPTHPEPHIASLVEEAYQTRASMFQNLRAPAPLERDVAWQRFQQKYVPMITAFATKCGANRQDIDDILQDVLTNFWGASGEFQYDPAKGRFRGWLKTVTVRAAIRRAGKNLRFRGVPLAMLPDAELAVEPEWNDVWENQLVSEALELLRQESGNNVTYRAFEEYVLRDRAAEIVANELGISVNRVHQAKSRMTKQLRSIVERLREMD
jgi:RNA polymerase sigma factor (sigma-70 family)